MTITEKVAYIQGLFDGMGLDKSEEPQAKVLSEVLDVLKEVGEEIDMLDATLDEHGKEFDGVEDALNDLTVGLTELEDEVYGVDDDDDDEDEDDEEEDDDSEDFFEVECPNCGEELTIDDEVLAAGSIDCPNCGQTFALSFDEDEESGDD